MMDHIIYYPDINDEHLREMKIFWDKDGEKSQFVFSYGLAQRDVEAAIAQGP